MSIRPLMMCYGNSQAIRRKLLLSAYFENEPPPPPPLPSHPPLPHAPGSSDDKTEVMLVIPPTLQRHSALPASICINGTDVAFSSLVRNLGVTFDQTLLFQNSTAHTSAKQPIYLYIEELRNTSTTRPPLPFPLMQQRRWSVNSLRS